MLALTHRYKIQSSCFKTSDFLLFHFALLPTLLLFELVLCQEDGPHQLPDRRLDRHEEFPGVSATKQKQRSEQLLTFSKSTSLLGVALLDCTQSTHPGKVTIDVETRGNRKYINVSLLTVLLVVLLFGLCHLCFCLSVMWCILSNVTSCLFWKRFPDTFLLVRIPASACVP